VNIRVKTASETQEGRACSVAAGFLAAGRIASIIVATASARISMAYIICEPCIGTKDTACVDVCPVDCIHPRKDESDFATAEMLYIHPDECIDCGACVPACPVEAIFALDETPQKWADFIPRNASHYDRG
jgi:ferredoxin